MLLAKLMQEQAGKNLSAMFDVVMDEHPDETVELLGLLCFVLAAAAVLYSPLSVRKIARNEAEKQKKINLWAGENGVGFGKKLEHYREVAYEDVAAFTDGEMLLLFPSKQNLIALPKTAVNDECWEFLCERLSPQVLGKREKSR